MGQPAVEHEISEVRLSRDMSLFSVTMIGVGAMIGAGIFVLTGIAAGVAGPGLIVAFAINGVLALVTAMAYAELGACFPEAGGGYLWVKEGLPGPAGFLSGWCSWFAHAVACSVYALGFGAYFHEVLRALGVPLFGLSEGQMAKLLALVVCAAFAYINFRGSAETGKAGAIVTVGKLVVLGLFVGGGAWAMFSRADWTAEFRPFFPTGASHLLMAMGLTYIAFEGYEVIAQSGEEVLDPRRNIPRAILISLGVVVPIYMLIAFVAIGGLAVEGKPSWVFLGEQKELAIMQAAKSFLPAGGVIILIGGLLSTVSALNATIYSSSRVAFAMARDHNLPEQFARVHPRRRTPHWAIGISAMIIAAMALALPIEDVASAADIMFLLLFMAVNLSVITLRYRRPELRRSFRVPLFPALPIFGALSQLFLALYMVAYSPSAWLVTLLWLGFGVYVYYTYAAQKERAVRASKVMWQERIPGPQRYTVVVPVANAEHVESLVTLAAAVAKQKQGQIVAVSVVRVPPQLPLAEGRRYGRHQRRVLETAARVARAHGVEMSTVLRVGHNIWKAILDTIEEEDADLVVMGWRGYTRSERRALGNTLDPIVRKAPCDVAVLKPAHELAEVRRVILGTTASTHGRFALELAEIVARELGVEIQYLHVRERGRGVDSATVRYFLGADRHPPQRPDVNLTIIEASSVARALIERAGEHDLLVVGAAREGLVRQLVFGTKAQLVAKLSRASVLMVKRYEGPVRAAFRGLLEQAEAPLELVEQ